MIGAGGSVSVMKASTIVAKGRASASESDMCPTKGCTIVAKGSASVTVNKVHSL